MAIAVVDFAGSASTIAGAVITIVVVVVAIIIVKAVLFAGAGVVIVRQSAVQDCY